MGCPRGPSQVIWAIQYLITYLELSSVRLCGLNGAENLVLQRIFIRLLDSLAAFKEHLDSSHLSLLMGDNTGLISNGKITGPGETELICDRNNSGGGQLFKHGCLQTTCTFKGLPSHLSSSPSKKTFPASPLRLPPNTEGECVLILIHISCHGQTTSQPRYPIINWFSTNVFQFPLCRLLSGGRRAVRKSKRAQAFDTAETRRPPSIN